jgi:hypothetical protein
MFYFVIASSFSYNFSQSYDSLTPRDVRIASFMGRREYPLHPKYCPFFLSEWISAALSLKKAQRRHERRRGDGDDDERQ